MALYLIIVFFMVLGIELPAMQSCLFTNNSFIGFFWLATR